MYSQSRRSMLRCIASPGGRAAAGHVAHLAQPAPDPDRLQLHGKVQASEAAFEGAKAAADELEAMTRVCRSAGELAPCHARMCRVGYRNSWS